MNIDIDKLSEEELIDLNNQIVERLRFLSQMRTHAQPWSRCEGTGQDVAPATDDCPSGDANVRLWTPTFCRVENERSPWRYNR